MSWTPPESASYYFVENDPLTGNYSADQMNIQQAGYLTGARLDAFGDVERGLSATSSTAETVAAGLRGADAQRADWGGPAADAFHDKLGKLPRYLDQVTTSYASALSALATFSDTTFALQAQYKTWLSDLDTFRNTWQTAVSTTYPDEATGQARLSALRHDLDELCARQTSILGNNDDASNTFQGAIEKLASDAPHVHESELQKLMSPITGFLDKVADTFGAIGAFAHDQTWKNFDRLTDDVAADASIVVLAVSLPEAAAGLGLLDAEGGLLTATELTGTAAAGLDTAATAGNVTAKEFDHEYGAGAFEALLVLAPGAADLASTSELKQTIGEAKLIGGYQTALAAGESPEHILAKLPADEQASLKAAIPDYTDPSAVAKAVQGMKAQLQDVAKSAGLVEAPKGFLWENGVLVPVANAAGAAADGHH